MPAIALASSSTEATTFVDIESDVGDVLGQGQSFHFDADAGRIMAHSFYNDRGGVEVDFYSNAGSFGLYALFHAPNNSPLEVGTTYTGATNYSGVSPSPAIGVYTNYGNCSEYSGEFTIVGLSYGANNSIESLAVEFAARCKGLLGEVDQPELRGKVYINHVVQDDGEDDSGDTRLNDDDGDGIVNIADVCPVTLPGVLVDHTGCSKAQFCSLRVNAYSCYFADWLDDTHYPQYWSNDCWFDYRSVSCLNRN
jgi:hypothetical protein